MVQQSVAALEKKTHGLAGAKNKLKMIKIYTKTQNLNY